MLLDRCPAPRAAVTGRCRYARSAGTAEPPSDPFASTPARAGTAERVARKASTARTRRHVTVLLHVPDHAQGGPRRHAAPRSIRAREEGTGTGPCLDPTPCPGTLPQPSEKRRCTSRTLASVPRYHVSQKRCTMKGLLLAAVILAGQVPTAAGYPLAAPRLLDTSCPPLIGSVTLGEHVDSDSFPSVRLHPGCVARREGLAALPRGEFCGPTREKAARLAASRRPCARRAQRRSSTPRLSPMLSCLLTLLRFTSVFPVPMIRDRRLDEPRRRVNLRPFFFLGSHHLGRAYHDTRSIGA
jgi:hypothetical protein